MYIKTKTTIRDIFDCIERYKYELDLSETISEDLELLKYLTKKIEEKLERDHRLNEYYSKHPIGYDDRI
jgi:hypothetical protein